MELSDIKEKLPGNFYDSAKVAILAGVIITLLVRYYITNFTPEGLIWNLPHSIILGILVFGLPILLFLSYNLISPMLFLVIMIYTMSILNMLGSFELPWQILLYSLADVFTMGYLGMGYLEYRFSTHAEKM